MKLTYAIQIYKSMFPEKNDLISTNILYTVSHKICLMHCDLLGGKFQCVFLLTFVVLNIMKLTYLIEVRIIFRNYKIMFHVHHHPKSFLYTIGYASKQLEMYF